MAIPNTVPKTAQLFDNSIPKTNLGLEVAEGVHSRRKFTGNGWTGTGLFTPAMSPQ
jgi:hypothetical protein